ncbi:MAG: hypothetical protein WD425_13300 [Nitrospirales bacterium]
MSKESKVKTKLLLIFFLILSFPSISEAEADFYIDKPSAVKLVQKLINAVKADNKKQVAALVNYPLGRRYPLKSIKNQEEFIENYSTLFDEKLKKEIIEFNPERDIFWNWQGIALLHGGIWLDFDGKIRSLNFDSDKEQVQWDRAIEKEKTRLHPSIRNFTKPILEGETKTHIIRIDQEGDEFYGNYRYSSWTITKTTKDRPDLVIRNGEMELEGTGGNHHYVFKNGKYIYTIYISLIGMAPLRDTLEVQKDGTTILHQEIQYQSR